MQVISCCSSRHDPDSRSLPPPIRAASRKQLSPQVQARSGAETQLSEGLAVALARAGFERGTPWLRKVTKAPFSATNSDMGRPPMRAVV